MAYSGYADHKNSRPYSTVSLGKNQQITVAGRLHSRWLTAAFAGAAPTTAVVPTYATAGALYGSPTGLAGWIKRMKLAALMGTSMLIYDRLSHQGGLSGTTTGAQTTNLPTAALTRFTNGVGVHVGLEVYTQIGVTQTTFSCSYTNSAGTAGRTSPTVRIGGNSERIIGAFIPMPLQQGDVGVKSVESVTLAATTGTAGNFGVVLYKPLALLTLPPGRQEIDWDVVRDGACMFEPVPADACLGALCSVNTTGTGYTSGVIELVKQI